MNYIIIVGVAQALLALGILAMNPKNYSQHDQILSFLLISIFLHLSVSFVLNVFWPNAEIHQQFNTFIALAYPGLLWYYTSGLIGHKNNSSLTILLLPALLASLVYFSIAIYVMNHAGKTPTYIKTYNAITGNIYIVLYILYPIKSLISVKRIARFWKMEKQLITLSSLLLLFLGLSLLFITCYNLLSEIPLYFPNVHLTIRILIYSILLIICMSIMYVKVHSYFYIHSYHNDPTEQPPMMNSINYPLEQTEIQICSEQLSASVQTDLEIKKNNTIAYKTIMDKVDTLMRNDRVYADPELRLDSLAMRVGISRHHLSETLNQFCGKSFYQFINEYRIKEVISLMEISKQKGQNPNILSLAYEAGFHSKSTFNLYFKKVQGCTPSAYLKKEIVFSFDKS